MKILQISSKEKTALITKISKLSLSKKENNLFQRILEKGIGNWNDFDVEFLTLMYDLHYHPILNIGGISIYPEEKEKEIIKEIQRKKEKATKRLNEEPYSQWFKSTRKYNNQNSL